MIIDTTIGDLLVVTQDTAAATEYYGYKRWFGKSWRILRNNTATGAIDYAFGVEDKENRDGYDNLADAWTNRATLDYTFPEVEDFDWVAGKFNPTA